MRLFGKAILLAAFITAISVTAQTMQTQIVGDYIALVMPPGTEQPETPRSPSRPVAPPNAAGPAGTPKWEAVAIRPCPQDVRSTGGGERGGGGGPFRFSSDRMTLNCLTVKSLIRSAYHLYSDLEFSAEDSVLFRGLGESRGFSKDPLDGTAGGPDWLDTDFYTIEAKSEVVTDRFLMQGAMLQAILEERFKIKVHRGTRDMAVEALVVARSGSKLKPFVEGSCVRLPLGASRRDVPQTVGLHIKADANGKLTGTIIGSRSQSQPLRDLRVEGQTFSFGLSDGAVWKGSIENNGARLDGVVTDEGKSMPLVFTRETAQTVRPPSYCEIGRGGPGVNLVYNAEGVTLEEFAKLFLSGNRGRFVIDKTGLTGKFNIHLESEIGPASTAPPLPEALQQQLGLRLESTKGPVEFLVIDHIERPSSN